MASIPAQASRNTAKASGPSKPCTRDVTLAQERGFFENGGHGANYRHSSQWPWRGPIRCYHARS